MATNSTIDVARYVPPGVYIAEDVLRSIPLGQNLPRQVVIVGEGDIAKTYTNEQVLRGYIENEAVTPNISGEFWPLLPADNKKTTKFLSKGGIILVASSFTTAFEQPSIAPTAAPITGTSAVVKTAAEPFNFAGAPLVLNLDINGTGNQAFTFQLADFAVPAAGTAAEVALVISATIVGAVVTTPIAGPDAGKVVITSTLFGSVDSSIDIAAGTANAILGFLPDPAIVFGTGAGNVDDGAHHYGVTFVVNGIESRMSALSGAAVIVDKTNIGQVSLTAIPTLANAPVGTTRKLYRTKVGFPTVAYLLATIADNTTTVYTDNTADAGLGALNSTAASGLTRVTITTGFYEAGGIYTFSYQSLVSANPTDELDGDVSDVSLARIVRVGSFPGISDYLVDQDYVLNNGLNSIEWQTPTAAVINGSVTDVANYPGLATTTLKLTVNGGVEQTHTFTVLEVGTGTAEEVATAINAAFAGLNCPTVAVDVVSLTTLTTGPNASIQVGNGTANAILGFLNGQTARGNGKTPAQGEAYYVTYRGTRPDEDFNTPILSTTFDSFASKVGTVASDNPLSLAGLIAFEQNPPFIWHVQVKKTDPIFAVASDQDYIDAIEACELNDDITDVVVLSNPIQISGGGKPAVRAALREHVIKMSSLLEKGERLGWFGMPIGTVAGDGDTPNTFVYTATQELQVTADSPGRGRFVLTGPSSFAKTYRLSDGTVRQLTFDSTFLAVGIAALEASFLSPAEGLLRKEVARLDTVETLTKADINYLAGNGVNLVTTRASRNIIFDPVTTDQSAAEFREINVMAQKDNIVKRVRRAVDDRIVGLVPDDLAQFIFEVKSVISGELNAAISDGVIAPFQNDDGTPRNIILSQDISVAQRVSDPTSYDFRFTFFVRFIAKRLFGLFTVSIPASAQG